jgi:hypothetical protein
VGLRPLGADGVGPVAVVVLATLGGQDEDDTLAALLGPVAAAALRRELLRGARRWAAAAATSDGPGAFEANSAEAALAALHGYSGAVALVAPDVPGLDAALADDLHGDLADGVGLTLAPTYDATPFLVGMPALDPELVRLAGAPREDFFTLVAGRGGPVGMLRSERRLTTAADARAVAADPRTPLELGVLLAAGLDVRARR